MVTHRSWYTKQSVSRWPIVGFHNRQGLQQKSNCYCTNNLQLKMRPRPVFATLHFLAVCSPSPWLVYRMLSQVNGLPGISRVSPGFPIWRANKVHPVNFSNAFCIQPGKCSAAPTRRTRAPCHFFTFHGLGALLPLRTWLWSSAACIAS